MRKVGRFIVVGTNKDGNIGAWDDMDSETWTAPWGVYDTEIEAFFPYSVGWRWIAVLLAIYLSVRSR